MQTVLGSACVGIVASLLLIWFEMRRHHGAIEASLADIGKRLGEK
jgi:hypothetical protein